MRWSTSWRELCSAILFALSALTLAILISSPTQARHYFRQWHPHYRQAYQATYRHYRRMAWRPAYRPAYRVYRAAPRPGYQAAYQPGIAAMVVDANTGKTLYASNENELRHPASITKVMTLYLLFEQMEKGRFRLDSPITISPHAAEQPPTKLGLPPGDTIAVEDAIKAVVTESANDIAVAIAEAIGGNEGAFAELMNVKARALGMTRTFYRNASGLPNEQQLTTARDLIILGRAIQERFPREYAYFSTRVFYYRGRAHFNHNHLLGRIEGLDGIKTGYTRGSGFNLLTSVRREGRHIVSVVLGGTSAGARDRIMAGLVESNLQLASAGERTAPMIAELPQPEPVKVAEATPSWPSPEVAPVPPAPAPAPPPRAPERAKVAAPVAPVAPASTAAPIPVARPRLAVVSGAPRTVQPDQTGSIPLADRKRIVIDGSTAVETKMAANASSSTTPPTSTLRWIAGPAGAGRTIAAKPFEVALAKAEPIAAAVRADTTRTPAANSPKSDPVRSESPKPAPEATSSVPQSAPREGWVIQIGATDDVEKANELLNRAKSREQVALASARPFTEKVQKGDVTLYRARFAGLEPDQAEAACRMLKRSGFDCFATRN
ncbi:MAG: SPOR domain-containing protein [Methylobacteriaceae bacterium]|nr:SPOR domain-containing protein [Methylobacteriaceae bacterium]